jgi:hypothetical protein
MHSCNGSGLCKVRPTELGALDCILSTRRYLKIGLELNAFLSDRARRALYRWRQPLRRDQVAGLRYRLQAIVELFRQKTQLLRALYYTALMDDQEYSSIRPLLDWLEYNGFTVVTNPAKEFTDASGRRKIKGNMDIELAVDALQLADRLFRRRRFPHPCYRASADGQARQCDLHPGESAADDRR